MHTPCPTALGKLCALVASAPCACNDYDSIKTGSDLISSFISTNFNCNKHTIKNLSYFSRSSASVRNWGTLLNLFAFIEFYKGYWFGWWVYNLRYEAPLILGLEAINAKLILQLKGPWLWIFFSHLDNIPSDNLPVSLKNIHGKVKLCTSCLTLQEEEKQECELKQFWAAQQKQVC